MIKVRNLVDDFRDWELVVLYDYFFLVSLCKLVIVFSSVIVFFVVVWLVGNIELKFVLSGYVVVKK